MGLLDYLWVVLAAVILFHDASKLVRGARRDEYVIGFTVNVSVTLARAMLVATAKLVSVTTKVVLRTVGIYVFATKLFVAIVRTCSAYTTMQSAFQGVAW